MSNFKVTMDNAKVTAFVTICKVIPTGALQARKLHTGAIAFYWRFTHCGKTERIVIGGWDSSIKPLALESREGRYSVRGAERAAEKLAYEHAQAVEQGLHGIRGKREADAARIAQLQRDRQLAATHTVAKLLADYADHIQGIGRVSHGDARSIFDNHVVAAWPEIANSRAADLTDEQVADMMRRLVDSNKGRTANKLRAYIHAAYEVARKSRTAASIPVKFKAYGIKHNPAHNTVPDPSANRADKNPLSAADLRRYWNAVSQVYGLKGAVLRLHILTGGQRIAQLLRLERAAIDENTILLRDAKGRPGKAPRDNFLPITKPIREGLNLVPELKDGDAGTYVFSSDGGRTHVSPSTLTKWAKAVAESANIPDFEPKRVRSGVETLLAAAGISKDSRGRLQSHGISGVQDSHYDAHDYLEVKRKALDTLHTQLTASDKIRSLRAA